MRSSRTASEKYTHIRNRVFSKRLLFFQKLEPDKGVPERGKPSRACKVI